MKRLVLLLPVVLLVVCVSVIQANTIHVPADSSTIKAGIKGAVDGDTVLVADGTYTGDGNRGIDFHGKAIVVMSENGPENCIIDCEEVGAGFYFGDGEDSNSVLQGFTITNGLFGSGGGIFCHTHSSPTIQGNTITGNVAYYGGGIFCVDSSSPIIQGNTITGNTSNGSGGGIYCDDNSSPTIMGNVITGNMANTGGGGITCWESSPTIQGNTIAKNTSTSGGGIYCYSRSSPTITSNTIMGNRGSGILCSVFSNPTISNSILWGNSYEIGVFQSYPVVTYSDVEGGWTGEGNIDEDPMFVHPDKDDCRLLWESPCIDAGQPFFFDPDSTRKDMGAHYFNQNDYLTLYMTPDTTEVAKGGQMGVTYTVINRWQQKEPFSALTRVTLPDGEIRTVLGPEDYNICPGYTVQIHLTYEIPPWAYLGMYDYQGEIGVRPSTLYDDDSFTFWVADSVWTHIEPWKPVRYEDFKLIASDAHTKDYFGQSVSVSGNAAIVGAYLNDDNGNGSGSAYVFRYEPGTVTCFKEQKLLASDGDFKDFFGYSVSIYDDAVLVGATGDDDNGDASGSVYVFRYYPNTETWIEEEKLLASDGDDGDQFGSSHSVFGDVAVIGAKGDEDNGGGSGSAYVFRYDPNVEIWIEEEKLLASDGDDGDQFGHSVSVSGDITVIGAYKDDDNGEDSGSAYVFHYDPGTQAWIEEEKLLASDGAEDDYFGRSVSVSGDIAVIGAHGDDDNGGYSGSAYVFRYDPGAQAWIEEEKLLASDGVGQDSFGTSVSVFGDVAVIGSTNSQNGWKAGAAYVFRYNPGTGTWIEEEKLLTSDGVENDWFGRAVSVSSEGAIIGADGNEDYGFKTGSAYVYHLEID